MEGDDDRGEESWGQSSVKRRKVDNCRVSSNWPPPNIDAQKAVETFRNHRTDLFRLVRHCLVTTTNSLFAHGLISEDVRDSTCNANKDTADRAMALLNCAETGLETMPSKFPTLIEILESEPYLELVAEKMINSYSTKMDTKALSSFTQSVSSTAISSYASFLKRIYKNSPISSDSKWPPTPSKKYINLVVVKDRSCRDEYIGYTLQGDVGEILKIRKEISIHQILEAEDNDSQQPRLVLIEGAPGIGKSTLVWELCRKWEEFPSMKQYKLVVLLRLREEAVQKVHAISDLFIWESELKASLFREVGDLGEGILFILDGFDELPKSLQQHGFLLNLIKGHVLPASSVLVTSRPSATGELLTGCRPQIQKYVEILGFNQKSIEMYAYSVFSSQPEVLKRFNAYISASDNPAINSLMYVPLNAAIIVEIFRDRRAGDILPHTLTELYTQLCLTILNRYLLAANYSRVTNFKDLPPALYQHFLALCSVAFDGIVNEEVVFHNIPSDWVHFGFLDAVPALYGGGGASYNFLHLTIQEFLAAYHLASLKDGGLTQFLEYGKVQRWHVVWRFVSGLTKFRSYEGKFDWSVFVQKGYRGAHFSMLFFQCLLEAQTIKFFSTSLQQILSATKMGIVQANNACSLDAYAIGYCIANFSIGVPWSVSILSIGGHHSFTCGLKTNSSCVGTIGELGVCYSTFVITELKANTLNSLNGLCFRNNDFTCADLIRLSELIPKLPCLKDLTIRDNRVKDEKDEGLLGILRQLHHSSVTYLDVARSGLSELFVTSKHDCFQALKHLIDPEMGGKIEHLCIGDFSKEISDGVVTDLLSVPTTLKHLELRTEDISLCKLHLQELVTFDLYLMRSNLSSEVTDLVNLVNHSKVLKVLCFRKYEICEQDIEKIKLLVAAIRSNCILHRVDIDNSSRNHDLNKEKFKNMIDQHHELRIDRRITWGRGLLVSEGIPHFGKLKLMDYYKEVGENLGEKKGDQEELFDENCQKIKK